MEGMFNRTRLLGLLGLGLSVVSMAFAVFYLEGYLWDPEEPRAAMKKAIAAAKSAGRKVAFTLSDGFVIERHGEDVIRRILHELPETRDLYVAIKNVTGEDVSEIGADWLKDARRATWPTYAHLYEPGDYGRPLTGPLVAGGVNANASLSPSGDSKRRARSGACGERELRRRRRQTFAPASRCAFVHRPRATR